MSLPTCHSAQCSAHGLVGHSHLFLQPAESDNAASSSSDWLEFNFYR